MNLVRSSVHQQGQGIRVYLIWVTFCSQAHQVCTVGRVGEPE
jgi:hypothetical protein